LWVVIYGIFFAAAGLGQLALAGLTQGPAWILAWPGLAFLLVGVACSLGRPRLLGKTSDGEVHLWARVLLTPFHGLGWVLDLTSEMQVPLGVRTAPAMMRTCRPRVRLSGHQRRTLEAAPAKI
jgi:hypothetical protein